MATAKKRTAQIQRNPNDSRMTLNPSAMISMPGIMRFESSLLYAYGSGMEEFLDLFLHVYNFIAQRNISWRLELLNYLLLNSKSRNAIQIYQLLNPIITGPLVYDPEVFFQGYSMAFKPSLTQSQQQGLQALLDFVKQDSNIRDIRWMAYMLATVKRECAGTWKPIEEYGRGKGYPYGNPVVVECSNSEVKRTYYGRGYVQLTWYDNYKKVGDLIKKNLVCQPELALDSQTAYDILSIGMRTGVAYANGHKLSDYISGSKVDYVGARHIVNGQDHAKEIAGDAKLFETLLLVSAHNY